MGKTIFVSLFMPSDSYFLLFCVSEQGELEAQLGEIGSYNWGTPLLSYMVI